MQTVLVKEPRVAIRADVEKNHVVHMGAQRTTPVVQTADSYQLSPSVPINAQWSVTPPSNQTIIDRYIKCRFYLDIKSTGGDFKLGLDDGLRQFPVSSIVDVASVSINGETVSENVQRKLHAMLCFGNDSTSRAKSWSMSAAMPDSYQKYSDYITLGSGKNPLAFYGENSAEPPRGGFEVVSVSSTNIRCVVTEPIWVSPMYNGHGHQQEGFVNVNSLDVNLRFSSDVGRVMCHSSLGNAITAVSCTFYQAPELLINYLTPNMLQPVPELQVLPYQSCQEYIRTMSQLAIGGSQTVFSDTIRLSQIPRRIFLFARRTDATNSFQTADSFPSIETVSISWGNQAGLLASATKQELFEISRRNGCNLDYPSFTKYRGSVLCLEMGKDIGLQDGEAPGVNGSWNIQAQVEFKNQDTAVMDCEFVMVCCNQGVFSIGPNTARASLGNLTQEDVLKAEQEMPHHIHEDLEGGSFWSGLKNIVHKVASVATPILGAVAPEFAPIAAGIKAATGSGMHSQRSGGRLSGGSIRRR
jgi:hypothetical protein